MLKQSGRWGGRLYRVYLKRLDKFRSEFDTWNKENNSYQYYFANTNFSRYSPILPRPLLITLCICRQIKKNYCAQFPFIKNDETLHHRIFMPAKLFADALKRLKCCDSPWSGVSICILMQVEITLRAVAVKWDFINKKNSRVIKLGTCTLNILRLRQL
jgi:hypothetical protein